MNSFYEQLSDRSRKRIALLVDPDGYDDSELNELIGYINMNPPDLLLVGGSLLFKPIEITITALKLGTSLPVFLLQTFDIFIRMRHISLNGILRG